MCLFPVTISRKNECLFAAKNARQSPSDYRRYIAKYGNELRSYSRLKRYGLMPYLSEQVTVPCGKCTECLKRRQNDLAVRCMREAEKRGSMSFVTLTYDDDSLPFACTLLKIDSETGEVIERSKPSLLTRYNGSGRSCGVTSEVSEFLEVVRGSIFSQKSSSKSRRFMVDAPFPTDEGFLYRYEVTPSLNRRDARLWLKRCRVRYKRDFGKACPDFSYVLVGEYGPNTARPHMHVCFFGLDFSIVRYFTSLWQYGFTNMKNVNAVNEDGSSGFRLASKYIGKYMVKGRFDCDCVLDGSAEKGRLCASRGVGKDLPASAVDYYRCYDLFGQYDIDSGRLLDGSYLSETQLKRLYSECNRRNHITIDGYRFSLPQIFIKQLWYVSSEKVPGSLRCSTVRVYFSRLAQSDPFNDYLRFKGKNPESCEVSRHDYFEACEFFDDLQVTSENQEKVNERAFRSELLKSIF